MSKVFLLGANKEIDRAVQVVEVNQIIQMEGYSNDKYVVHAIVKNDWGISYKLINLRTKEFNIADIIRPLKEKFGIGYYYDSENPQFMDAFEVAILLQEAQQKKIAEAAEAEKERIRVEEVKKIGRVRFAEILPENARAVIVGRLKQDDSDPYTDYFSSSTQRTVILGFSTHQRDIFSEMRKHASNFAGTAYLSEYNANYENREKYSMGAGYYLGESKYHGWIIEKVRIYDPKRTIEEFAYIAGSDDNIHIKTNSRNTPEEREAEWEYAARGGKETSYFFPGSAKDFSEHGFMRNIFKPKTDSISSYVIYNQNSSGRTQLPSEVMPNPFGLRNMLGNVMEYTADKYDPDAYSKRGSITSDPIVTEGDEWVVRGGYYNSDAADVRSASRSHTEHDDWMRTDPQQPKSIWWYSDIKGIGFRVVCDPDSSLK